MYKDYLKERENAELVEFPHGFVVLKIFPESIYLQDMYVVPEKRMTGQAWSMLKHIEQVAIAAGKLKLVTSCSPPANGSTISLKAILAGGFQLESCDKDMIYLTKDLSQKEV
jgi:hypothetical protein